MNQINRQIFDGAKYTLTFSMVQYILFIATQVIFARFLSPSIFGEFAMITIAVMFFFTLANFSTDKYIIISKSLKDSEYNSLVVFDIIYALLIYLLFYFIIESQLLPIINYDYKNYILLFGCIIFFHPFSRNKAILEKELKFFEARFPAAVSTMLSSLLSIFLIWKGYTILALIIWRLAQYIFEAMILLFIQPRTINLSLDTKTIKKLIKFSAPLLLSNVIIFFYWNIDYVIVENLLGKEQLGYYWLAFQLGLFILRIKDAFINVIFPIYSRTESKNETDKSFNHLSIIVIKLLGLILMIFLFFGKEIFMLSFGEKWLPALYPFIVTIILSMLRSFTSFFEPIFLIHKKTKIKLVLSILNAILVPLLVFIMVKNYGIIGAPIGVLISNFLSTCLLIFLTRKFVSINFIPIINNIAILLCAALLSFIVELEPVLKILMLIIITTIFIKDENRKINTE